jgi:hypothetical protein
MRRRAAVGASMSAVQLVACRLYTPLQAYVCCRVDDHLFPCSIPMHAKVHLALFYSVPMASM